MLKQGDGAVIHRQIRVSTDSGGPDYAHSYKDH